MNDDWDLLDGQLWLFSVWIPCVPQLPELDYSVHTILKHCRVEDLEDH